MIEANTPAFPFTSDAERDSEAHSGITKREHFAAKFTAAFITGICSGSGNEHHGWSDKDFAEAGISVADALIEALNKE